MSRCPGEEDARQLLEETGQTEPPFNVRMVAQRCGLLITAMATVPLSVAGFLYKGPHRSEIIVNARHPRTRRRFTAAHEIGEFLSGEAGVVLMSLTDAEWLTPHEMAMNEFAAHLLMPRAVVQSALDDGADFPTLCRTFDVSKQAMSRRLRALDQTA